MKKAYVILLMLLITVDGYAQKKPYFHSFYSKAEVVEIERIINFVVNEVSEGCSGDTTPLCFIQYFQPFDTLGAADELKMGLSLNGQKKLMETLDSGLVKDIWSFEEATKNQEHTSSQIQLLVPNYKGRFAKFFRKMSRRNKKLTSYYEPFELIGVYTPSMNAFLLKRYYQFDFNSKDDLFLVAIHILCLNFPEEGF